MTAIEPQHRTVYRAPSAGRAYLTKRAAYRAEARARLQERCECSPPDYVDNGMGFEAIPGTETVCRYHHDDDLRERIIARWARLLAAHDREAE